VLFYLPITKTWLFQLILGLILVCHCSYRGVVELLRICSTCQLRERFTTYSQLLTKPLRLILPKTCLQSEVGLQDEIFQGSQPVLVGSMPSQLTATYWRRLEHRDEDAGVHLLDASQQVYPLTTPLLTLRKDSELGGSAENPVMEIFFTSSRQRIG